MAFRYVWQCSNCAAVVDWRKPTCPNCQHAYSTEKQQWQCGLCRTLNDYADYYCTHCRRHYKTGKREGK
jgi:hypothetical protein